MKTRAITTVLSAIFTILVTVSITIAATEDSRIFKAEKLFEQYVLLEHTFDSGAADLYSDNAVIRNKRRYPTGQVRELSLPAQKYKELVRSSMPIAKLRGDTNSYSEVNYFIEGEGVRINAVRFSELKKYSSPISLLVKPSQSGNWLIFEEISESQP